jgi:nucleoside-diphosphate-sugar epimerase
MIDMRIDPSKAIKGRRVFVTGASGFIGRRLVAALVDAGAAVTVLSRSRHGTGHNHGSTVATVIGNLDDAVLLESGLKGQEIIFHLAYDVRAPAAANLAAFNTLLGAAVNAPVGRIVHTSSIVVYDGWPDHDIDETGTMQRPGGGAYRQAKIEMERHLMRGSLPAAILQPTIVYGPGSALWTDRLAEALVAGGIVLPTPEGKCNGIFVDDVVQVLLRAAVIPDLGQERFIVSGPTPFSWSQLLGGYARIIGKGTVQHSPIVELRARLGPKPDVDAGSNNPTAMARIGGAGRKIVGRERFEALARLSRRRLAKGGVMHPNHHLLEVFSATGTCCINHARERLEFTPAFDLARGLAATEAHLKSLVRAN